MNLSIFSILEDYVKSKGDPLWALYEISGAVDSSEFTFLPAEAQIIKHVVVPESDLTDTKSKFSEVFSTCLHSIQRTNPKDTRVYGRSWADNDDLKGKKLPEQLKPQKKSDSSNVKVEKEKSTEQKPTIEPSTSSKSAIETKKSSIAPPKKQGTLSMFSKKTEKKTEKTEKSQSPVPQDQEKKNRKRPMIEVDESEELIKATKPKEKTPEKKPEKLIISQDSDEFPSSREQSVEKEKSPPAKRKRVNDENKKAKKRLIVPDSDDEEQVPMEVEEKKTETKTNSSLPEDRRRTTRIEKVVETYVDEDGYLGELKKKILRIKVRISRFEMFSLRVKKYIRFSLRLGFLILVSKIF